nr:hypothetical protein BaRGS_020843 [Batillaria attramentaria]
MKRLHIPNEHLNFGSDPEQAESLKATISESGKSISDLWVTRQRLEDLYKRLLLMDLEYALDKKVEQDLWNHAFKNQITALQTQAKDKSNPKKTEVQANLNLFLETASGFYLQFLQLICSTFRLDLPFRRKSAAFGVMKEKCQLRSKITPPKKSSCLYICQYCLVHLGDIARYRQQVEQAQTYYRHAVNLSPQNGQPYNQLAILEVNRNNKLSSVFYYVRSLAVRHPFPVAATNLEKFYSKLIKDTSEFKGKMAQNEFVNAFLQFQALLHLAADFNRASYLCSRILACLPAHLMSQTFSASVLVQCIAITIFTLNHVRHVPSGGESGTTVSNKMDESGGGGDGEGKKNTDESSSRPKAEVLLSDDEQKSVDIILGFTASVLELLVQHTPRLPVKARESPTLPAIQVLLDWLRHSPDIIANPPFSTSNIWGHLAKILNVIQQFAGDKPKPDLNKYEEVPLPEDTELRCFQPIEKAHSKYSFSRIPLDGFPRGVEELVRSVRLVNQGKSIAEEFPELKLSAIQEIDYVNFSAPENRKVPTTWGLVTSARLPLQREVPALSTSFRVALPFKVKVMQAKVKLDQVRVTQCPARATCLQVRVTSLKARASCIHRFTPTKVRVKECLGCQVKVSEEMLSALRLASQISQHQQQQQQQLGHQSLTSGAGFPGLAHQLFKEEVKGQGAESGRGYQALSPLTIQREHMLLAGSPKLDRSKGRGQTNVDHLSKRLNGFA